MIFEGFSTENKKLVQTISTSADTFTKDIFETHAERLSSRGNHFTAEELIPVYFAALVGTPSEEDEQANFHNMLYNLREDLIKCPKLLLYTEYELKAPTPDELSVFDGLDTSSDEAMLEGLCGVINIGSDPVRTKLAKETLPLFLKNLSGEAMLETAKTLIVWMNRCLGSEAYRMDHTEIPVLMYYGNITPTAITFCTSCQGSELMFFTFAAI